MPEAKPPVDGVHALAPSPAVSVNSDKLPFPVSCETMVRPCAESVKRIGSELVCDVSKELTSFHDAVAGRLGLALVVNVTCDVVRFAWYMILWFTQSAPMDGSTASVLPAV